MWERQDEVVGDLHASKVDLLPLRRVLWYLILRRLDVGREPQVIENHTFERRGASIT
jgi:hypothetical protein